MQQGWQGIPCFGHDFYFTDWGLPKTDLLLESFSHNLDILKEIEEWMVECQHSACFDNNLTISAQLSKTFYAYFTPLLIDCQWIIRFLASTNYISKA